MKTTALEQRIARLESSNAALKRWLCLLGSLVLGFAILGANQAGEKQDTSRVLRARELHLLDGDGHEYAAILVHRGFPQLQIKHKDGARAGVVAADRTGFFAAKGPNNDHEATLMAGESTQLSLEYGKAEYMVSQNGRKPFSVSNEGAP